LTNEKPIPNTIGGHVVHNWEFEKPLTGVFFETTDENRWKVFEQILKNHGDAEKWNRSKLLLDKNQDIVTLLKKLLEPYPKGNFDIDAPEDCVDACREIQKILGEKKLPSTSGEIYEDITKYIPKGEKQ